MSHEMLKSILLKQKTETRRVSGLKKINEVPDQWVIERMDVDPISGKTFAVFNCPSTPLSTKQDAGCPYGKPGDLLWVREAWAEIIGQTIFKFSIEAELWAKYGEPKWKPGIHLKKEKARTWLMVKEITLERLTDITEESALAEGCNIVIGSKTSVIGFATCRTQEEVNGRTIYYTAKEGFQTCMKHLHHEDIWHQNPWVWVVKFKALSKDGKPSEETIIHERASILNVDYADAT